jgi:hypothetical protein
VTDLMIFKGGVNRIGPGLGEEAVEAVRDGVLAVRGGRSCRRFLGWCRSLPCLVRLARDLLRFDPVVFKIRPDTSVDADRLVTAEWQCGSSYGLPAVR